MEGDARDALELPEARQQREMRVSTSRMWVPAMGDSNLVVALDDPQIHI
jgi:hypothetical protein